MPTLSLTQMVDLALGNPEVGAVNFNVLHTLFHAIIGKLNIGEQKADLHDDDKEFLTKKKPDEVDTQSEADSAVTGLGTAPSSANASKGRTPHVPYHALENKVAKLQEQLQALNELPTNKDLFDRATGGDGEKPRPVSDMWQNMQLQRRVGSNEDGVKKLMSLVEDMMGDMQKLRDQNEELQKQLEKALEDIKPADNNKHDDTIADLLKRLKDLENEMNALNDKMSLYPSPDTFNDFVTWTSLEDALKGLRDNLAELQNQPERVVIEMSSQTDAASRPASSRSRASTPGPSEALIEILEKLGRLSDGHDKLEERVTTVEEDLKNKVDKGALEGLGVPEELINQLKELQEQLEALKKDRVKDSDALSRMQQAILQLQAEIERISNTTQQLIDDNNNNKSNIESIFGHCSKLEENKADKEFVQTEVEVKADKRHLDGKVNRSLFDSTCDELNKMINDILAKLAGNEDEWKKLLGQLSDDLDGKLDRLEFGPIKDELERQLKALLKRLNSLHSHGDMDEDDAAGLRKQLVQRFHCISCDRPVDMAPQGPIPSIPETKGLPATRSTRPYTTFELDTIRQHAKSAPQGQTQIDIMDLYATQRQCGGSHTMTYPHRRMTRLAQMNSFFREDDVVPTYKEEQEICGADGHVYKGRHDQNKLPNLQGSSPKSARKGGSGPRPPTQASAHSPRPVSARGASRSVSVRDDRPQSAQRSRDVTTEVPTGRGYSTPPPAPAPSEPDPQDTARSPSPTPATVEQVA